VTLIEPVNTVARLSVVLANRGRCCVQVLKVNSAPWPRSSATQRRAVFSIAWWS